MQSCQHEGWNNVIKYLTEEVPLLLKTEDVKDVQELLTVVFKLPPPNLRQFIKWVAEVREQEDGNVKLSVEERGRLAVKVLLNFFMLFFSFNYLRITFFFQAIGSLYNFLFHSCLK